MQIYFSNLGEIAAALCVVCKQAWRKRQKGLTLLLRPLPLPLLGNHFSFLFLNFHSFLRSTLCLTVPFTFFGSQCNPEEGTVKYQDKVFTFVFYFKKIPSTCGFSHLGQCVCHVI